MSSDDPDSPDTTIKNLFDAEPLPEIPGPQPVSEAELVRWLTAQFQTYPECAAVTVEQVFRLDAPDAEGCNWSRTLVVNPAGAPAGEYARVYAAVLEKARRAFVLEPSA